MLKRSFMILVLMAFFAVFANGQVHKVDSLNKPMLKKLAVSEALIYGGAMFALGQIWYKDSFDKNFKFFNDNKQWNGLDKVGHIYTAYQLTAFNAKLIQNTGVRQKKAYLFSALASSTMMLGIEVFDGFSSDYGASGGDLIANTAGAFLAFQETIWDAVYIHPKYSFFPTKYAAIRPSVLGNGINEEWLKDYNGQTYWISTNFNVLSRNNDFPGWLAFSIGYGADGMVYGNNAENNTNGYQAIRQVYLSLDLDFTKFHTNKKWLKNVFYALNMIKVPLPTIGITQKGVSFYPIYF
ncbi:MAG: hypothetical protein ACJAT1_002107 [Marivirga sp.]|jgi:uncharacterized protein YfiM (DUF2279 family)